jgi:hypothetical protein
MRVVVVHFQWNGVVNLKFRNLDGNEAWREALAEEWLANMAPFWMSGLVTMTSLHFLEMNDLVPGGADQYVLETGDTPSGTVEGDIAPHHTAGLIRWTTDTFGRSGRGRSFIYGLPIANIESGNFWSEPTLEYFDLVGGEMLGQYGPGGTSTIAEFGILSKQTMGAPRDSPLFIPVTGFTRRDEIATVRHRVYLIPE